MMGGSCDHQFLDRSCFGQATYHISDGTGCTPSHLYKLSGASQYLPHCGAIAAPPVLVILGTYRSTLMTLTKFMYALPCFGSHSMCGLHTEYSQRDVVQHGGKEARVSVDMQAPSTVTVLMTANPSCHVD